MWKNDCARLFKYIFYQNKVSFIFDTFILHSRNDIIIAACSDQNLSSEKWLSRSSHWLSHIQNTLNAACLIAQCLDKHGASVLVHGTGGQDATLIVCSLAQVILNPDCRTVRGMSPIYYF